MPKSILGKIPTLSYKLMQRIMLLDITRLLWLDGTSVPLQPLTRRNVSFRLLNGQSLAKYSRDTENELGASVVMRMETGNHFCCAAKDKQGLAAYAWIALDSIEAENNRGAHPDSGVAMSFPRHTAFVYQAFTRPDLRGQGLFPACVNAAREALHPSGVVNLLSTTEWTNRAAIKSFQKIGFQELGLVWRVGLGNMNFTIGPTAATARGIQVGALDDRISCENLTNHLPVETYGPSFICPPAKPICQLPLRDSSFRQRWD